MVGLQAVPFAWKLMVAWRADAQPLKHGILLIFEVENDSSADRLVINKLVRGVHTFSGWRIGMLAGLRLVNVGGELGAKYVWVSMILKPPPQS